MNFDIMIASFTSDEFKELGRAVFKREKIEAHKEAENLELLADELALIVQEHYVEAIMKIRDRTKCDLLVAKLAVDKRRKW